MPRHRSKLSVDLSEPVPIPPEAIERAIDILHSGRLFRYGEFVAGESEVARLEREFADYLGRKYAVGMNSCGSTMFIALKSSGVEPGDKVLLNAFTLAPVPGAVEHAGAEAVFVESDRGCRIDLADLETKAKGGARALLLSHMRGHIADMDAVCEICDRHDVLLIEDCAHTLGAKWNGRRSGTFGHIACFSLQTFKHINAGEGGLLVTDDDEIAAKAILYSGSYMLYAQNAARPAIDAFESLKTRIPNFSLRMNELTAAVARPQLRLLGERKKRWRRLYQQLAELLSGIEHVRVPERDEREDFVPSSIQFFMEGLDEQKIADVLDACSARGVDIKWFGRPAPHGFTSTWRHWEYVDELQSLPETGELLKTVCDMRIPLSLAEDDCRLIADTLADAISGVNAE